MSDENLRRLRSFRDSLDSQDAIILEALRADPKHAVSLPTLRTIRIIFDEISQEVRDLVQTFERCGQATAVRSQIAGARRKLQVRIDGLEREAAEEAKGSALRVSVPAARQLLSARVSESRTLFFALDANPEAKLRTVRPWIDRTLQTLQKLFISPWQKRQFEERFGLVDLNGDTPEALLGRFDGAIQWLLMLDEQLFLMEQPSAGRIAGRKIFIGHGRSLIWYQLKDFIQTRLHLIADEFNREPPAGLFTGERLVAMLEDSCFAFLIMTAEDEQPDGRVRARENVVHEVGLFQGHLGFKRAIILLEEGCEPFSNIAGLTVIRFPKGDVSARFDEIRRTLEREGIVHPYPDIAGAGGRP